MPNSVDMEQVRELLSLIKGMKTNGRLVAASFIVRRVQPCKERATQPLSSKGRPTKPGRGRRCCRGTLWKSGLQSYLLRLPHSACQGIQSPSTAKICLLR